MVDLWLIKGNVPEQWNFDDVELERGVRKTLTWSNKMLSQPWIKKYVISAEDNFKENDQTGNSVSFLNTSLSMLEYKEGQTINTVNVYKHPDYIIQAMYISEYNFKTSDEFNYFASVVNTESFNIFGPVVFFKTQNKKTVSLSIDDLLCCMINYYYVKSYKLKNNSFEEIAINNFEPDIDKMFRGYTVRQIDDWMIFSDDCKSNLKELKEKDNDINNFNNIIFMKLKKHTGELHEIISSFEHNKDSDYRGLYMDIDESFIRRTFF